MGGVISGLRSIGLLVGILGKCPAVSNHPDTVCQDFAPKFLGMGNGSVFQLVPQRFQKEIGVMTGIVGAAGGIGGFFLPNLLGSLKRITGSFGPGFVVFAGTGLACAGLLLALKPLWQRTFLNGVPKAGAISTERSERAVIATAVDGRPVAVPGSAN